MVPHSLLCPNFWTPLATSGHVRILGHNQPAAHRDGSDVQLLLPVRSTDNVLGTSQREHRDRSHADGLPGIVCEAGEAPGLFVVDAVALLAGEFVDGHRIGVGAPLDGALAGCDEVVEQSGFVGAPPLVANT